MMRSTLTTLAALALTGTVMLATAASGLASGTSCPPIAAAQLHSILGLPNSLQARNTINDSGPAIDYLCNGVAWSGPPPTSLQAAFQLAKSGRGAAFAIETWAPNDGSSRAAEGSRPSL